MNFVNVHEDVIEGHILPFLTWNDLLRYRRVCKTFHGVTATYMKAHPELAPELEINEEEKNIVAFMNMGIPTTKLFINNEHSGHEYFEENKKTLKKFLKQYGTVIKCLRLAELAQHIYDNEWKFLDGLKCLESLEAYHFGGGFNDIEDIELANEKRHNLLKLCTDDNPMGFPSTFANLKSFKVGHKIFEPLENVILHALPILKFCTKLEYISLPFNDNLYDCGEGSEQSTFWLSDSLNAMAFSFFNLESGIMDHVKRLGNTTMKTVDFTCYHSNVYDDDTKRQLELYGSQGFVPFCVTCMKNGIQLTNVGSSWFEYQNVPGSLPEVNSPEIGKVIVSMVNVQPSVFRLDMCNLEQVIIQEASQCTAVLEPGQSRPDWPALKILKINVDFLSSLNPKSPLDMLKLVAATENTFRLFNFFFKDVRRIALTTLWLNFENTETAEVAVPKTSDIVNACPNLKKLTIINWRGTNKNLVKLWSGLPGLEEITLENCKQLGNVAFVGEDRENPVFFKLKNLKKLSLMGLDQMPKITDILFFLVISHLKLTHFTLTSATPVSSVTKAGVECLLTGPFADYIEKFPFSGWSLENVSREELKAIGMKFRSYNML